MQRPDVHFLPKEALWQMWTMPQAGIEIQVQKEASLVYLLAG
jgi:hypothetical protein